MLTPSSTLLMLTLCNNGRNWKKNSHHHLIILMSTFLLWTTIFGLFALSKWSMVVKHPHCQIWSELVGKAKMRPAPGLTTHTKCLCMRLQILPIIYEVIRTDWDMKTLSLPLPMLIESINGSNLTKPLCHQFTTQIWTLTKHYLSGVLFLGHSLWKHALMWPYIKIEQFEHHFGRRIRPQMQHIRLDSSLTVLGKCVFGDFNGFTLFVRVPITNFSLFNPLLPAPMLI